MPSVMLYDSDRVDVVKWYLITGGFADAVCDPVKKSTICSRVAAEVVRLTPSGRFTISPTSAELTTGSRTVRWHMKSDYSLMVTVSSTASWAAPSMLALTTG